MPEIKTAVPPTANDRSRNEVLFNPHNTATDRFQFKIVTAALARPSWQAKHHEAAAKSYDYIESAMKKRRLQWMPRSADCDPRLDAKERRWHPKSKHS
mmetsp:Transcript_123891/g.276426  ORF Transcript_123891/g.276426 Transcript_123891/m.276426 type:complete len:98 (+) Transcript_123891:127-420(+)